MDVRLAETEMGLEKAGRLLLHLRPSYRRGRGSPLRRRPDVDELLDLGLLCKTPPHEYLMRWRSLEPAHPGLRTVPRRRKDRDSTTTPDHWDSIFFLRGGFLVLLFGLRRLVFPFLDHLLLVLVLILLATFVSHRTLLLLFTRRKGPATY